MSSRRGVIVQNRTAKTTEASRGLSALAEPCVMCIKVKRNRWPIPEIEKPMFVVDPITVDISVVAACEDAPVGGWVALPVLVAGADCVDCGPEDVLPIGRNIHRQLTVTLVTISYSVLFVCRLSTTIAVVLTENVWYRIHVYHITSIVWLV